MHQDHTDHTPDIIHGHGEATSADGRYRWHSLQPGSVGIACHASDLPDNGMAALGWHWISCQHPGDTPSHHVVGARTFLRRVKRERAAIQAEQDAQGTARELAASLARQAVQPAHRVCPHCGTWCYGDCQEDELVRKHT